MPVIPVPGGVNLLRLVGLAILVLIVVLTSPAILLCSLVPPWRAFFLQLLAELRAWTRELIGGDKAPRDRD